MATRAMLTIPRTPSALFYAVHAELSVEILRELAAARRTLRIFAVGFNKLFAAIAAFIAFEFY